MPCWVYILQSETTGRHYCGQTGNLERRLREHNDPLQHRTTQTTKRFEGPWQLMWSRECVSRSAATRLERAIKGRGLGRYLAGCPPAPSRC